MSNHFEIIEDDFFSIGVVVDSGNNFVVLVSNAFNSDDLGAENSFSFLDTGDSLNLFDRNFGKLFNILDNIGNLFSFSGHNDSRSDNTALSSDNRNDIVSSVSSHFGNFLSLFVDFDNNCELLLVDFDNLIDFVYLRVFNDLDDVDRFSFDDRVFIFNVLDAGLN